MLTGKFEIPEPESEYIQALLNDEVERESDAFLGDLALALKYTENISIQQRTAMLAEVRAAQITFSTICNHSYMEVPKC